MEAKQAESNTESEKIYTYKNVFIGGKLIRLAKQERRGNKLVLVDPKGHVVHTLNNFDLGFKRRNKKR